MILQALRSLNGMYIVIHISYKHIKNYIIFIKNKLSDFSTIITHQELLNDFKNKMYYRRCIIRSVCDDYI